MRLENEDSNIQVFLSERNLKSLLAKLGGDPPDSACTLVKFYHDATLLVTAEPDALHYAHTERGGVPAGAMHPDTERALVMSERLALAEAKLKEFEVEWNGRDYVFSPKV